MNILTLQPQFHEAIFHRKQAEIQHAQRFEHMLAVRPEFVEEAQRIRELREAHAEWIRSTRRDG